MAKVRIYLRIASNKGGRKSYRVSASTEPNSAPIEMPAQYNKPTRMLPTVSFGIDLNIPDDLFKQAERVVGEIDVATRQATVGAEVLIPAIKKALRETREK